MSQSFAIRFSLALVMAGAVPAMADDTIAPKPDPSPASSYEVADSNGLPTRIKGLGTYAGGISARRFKGNGIYFYVDGDRRYGPPPHATEKTPPQSGAKIIDVGEAQPAMDCDDSGDICVIRP